MSDPKRPSPEAQRRLYYLIGSFAAIITLYTVLFRLEMRLFIDLLYIVTSALFVVYFFMSYGFARELPTANDLNPAWSEEKRRKYAERIRLRKERSKSLIYLLVPLIAVMAFDMIFQAFIAVKL